jgi:hypothetical protein
MWTFVQGHTGMLLVLLNYLSEKKLYRLDLNVLLVNSKNWIVYLVTVCACENVWDQNGNSFFSIAAYFQL